MAGETQTLRINIDASGARRGAAQWVSSLDKIASATKNFDKMAAQMGKSGKSNGFAAMARQLAALNGVKINPSLAKNVNALSQAMASLRGPSSKNISNIRSLFAALNSAKLNGNTGRNLALISSSLSNFKGPSKSATTNIRTLFSALNTARVSSGVATGLASISNALSNFKGMGAGSARNFQTFVTAVNGLRVPPGISQLGYALSGLSSRFGSSSNAAIRFGGSVNGIPWGRASAGAVKLTGNLRGLENAMSLSYQMGSQLRVLFGALTVSGFTAGVVEATTSVQRLETVLGAIGMDSQMVGERMQFATDVAYKYGISLLDVQKEFGRFSASAGATGLSVDQTAFAFESLAANMRLFGLSAPQQALAIKAVTQMFQKGSIQAEEFKNQLGDQMPGAFEALRRVLVKLTGDANVDPMEMMRKGMLDSDLMLNVLEEMNNMFGKGFEDASQLAVASMENLKSAWTEFLALVGNNGVMDALGDVSDSLTAILRGDEFQSLAKDIGEGLGNAIRKAGAAAEWLLNNMRQVGQVVAAVLGAKAIHTAMQLGAAFGTLGSMVTAVLAPVGRLMGAFSGLVGLGRGVALLGPLVGLLGAAFGGAAIVGGAALALLWNETIKVGDATTTVGSMAKIAFEDFGNWAQWAGARVMEMFSMMGNVAGSWFTSLNESITGGEASWEDWAKKTIGWVVLVGSTMVDVFKLAWKVLVDGAVTAGNLVGSVIGGLIGTFAALGDALQGNFTEAARKAKVSADVVTGAFADVGDYFNETGELFAETMINAGQRTEDYVAGIDFVTSAWDGSRDSMINYFEENAKRAAAADKANQAAKPEDKPFVMPTLTDREGLSGLKNADEDVKALGSIGKAAKSSADALKAYQEDQAKLDEMFASGAINADQYAESIKHIKSTLEEVADPYAAMIRNMQEENNILRLNGKEQRLASAYQTAKNSLLDQGIALTAENTAELKKLIAEQDKLNNPSPLQSWIQGMEEFGDAIESAGVKAMEGLSDSLADLVVDGKADWASLAKTILKDLIKIGLNEVWKGMFGVQQAQQPVNAPMSGAVGAGTLAGLAQTDTIDGMAAAVAKGIAMSNAGFGTAGNDVGRMPSFDEVGSFAKGNVDGVGAGAGKWSDFASTLSSPNAGRTPGGHAGGAVDLAESMVGMNENVNASSINAFLKKGGVDINAAQTAWCAGFVNSSLEQMGIEGSGSLVANDFLNWGQKVDPSEVMRGDVMVKNNGLGAGQTGGHVGMATGKTRLNEMGQQQMEMLSGNSSDSVKYDWYNANQVQLRRAPGEQGASGLPGMAGGGMGVANSAGAGVNVSGLGEQIKAEMTPAIQQVATQIPGQFDQPMSQVAQQLPQKLVPQGDALGKQVLSASQPGNSQAAQDAAQKYMETNSIIAQDLGAKASAALGGAGGVDGAGGIGSLTSIFSKHGGNNAGGGGFGDIMGFLGPILGGFFAKGGTVGKSGGSQRSSMSSLIGDPTAQPIVAHEGELITPAHEVDRMRRMGKDAALVDNAAVTNANSRRSSSSSDDGDGSMSTSSVRSAPGRPVVNFNITTKDADSFRASQGQIHAKAGAAAYRDAVRNH